MHTYVTYAAERGLRLSNSRAVCLHAVLGMKCPDYGLSVCHLDAPEPFARIMDHRVLYRVGDDRVLLVEPYADPEEAAESARILAEVLNLKYAVGKPGSGPWAAAVDDSGIRTALVPVAFAKDQWLAHAAVEEVAR
jgi:hypothetical protein